jgi:hypothetical protein
MEPRSPILPMYRQDHPQGRHSAFDNLSNCFQVITMQLIKKNDATKTI